MGRVVITHSTYLDDLVPILKKMSLIKKIKTITPGKIERTRGKAPRLQLNITTSIRGGFKLIARKGKVAQEVFVITELDKDSLKKIIDISFK